MKLLSELLSMYGFMVIILLSGTIPAAIGLYIIHKQTSNFRIRDKVYFGIRGLFVFCILLTVPSCTENVRAKTFGGTTVVELPPKTKLVSATWKDTDLWYLYRPANPGETPTSLTLKEDSSFGLLEGQVIFNEH